VKFHLRSHETFQTSPHQTVQHLAASVFSCFSLASQYLLSDCSRCCVFAYVFLLTPHRQQTKDYKIMSLSAVCIPKWLCLVQRARSVHMWKHSQSFLRFAKSKTFFSLLSATIFLPRAERRNGFFVCLPEKLNGSGPRIKKGGKVWRATQQFIVYGSRLRVQLKSKCFPFKRIFVCFVLLLGPIVFCRFRGGKGRREKCSVVALCLLFASCTLMTSIR
jgi:hypothetical protein